jgi:small subunit ribosomal protein S20
MAKRHKSALKQARQAEKKRIHNVVYRSRIKTFTKQVKEELKKGDKEKTKEALVKLVSTFDKATQKGIIKKETASRKKSRMTKMANELLLKTQLTSSPGAQESMDDTSSHTT